MYIYDRPSREVNDYIIIKSELFQLMSILLGPMLATLDSDGTYSPLHNLQGMPLQSVIESIMCHQVEGSTFMSVANKD